MRMRRKPWARPELAACPFFWDNPDAMRGKWRLAFAKAQPLWLELGCGKGAFLAQAAAVHREINFIGVDLKSDILGVARRQIVDTFAEHKLEPDNVLLFAHDIERIFLAMGADDYITKPFRVRELLCRIRTVLRRAGGSSPAPGVLERCGLTVNLAQAKVTKNGSEIILTALEYRLLLALLNHEGQTLTRNQLLEEIWDVAGDFVNDNTLTVYVKRLRDKIEDDPQDPKIIRTVRGLGYRVGRD